MSNIHSQSNLQPENYSIVDYFDSNEAMNIEKNYINDDGSLPARGSSAEKNMIAEIQAFYDKMKSYFGDAELKCKCDHCGKRTRYFSVALHKPTNTHIAIGENCLANNFNITNDARMFKHLRETAQRHATMIARREALAKLQTTDAELFNAITTLNAQIKNRTETVEKLLTDLGATTIAQRDAGSENLNQSFYFMESMIRSIHERSYVASEKQRAVILSGITRGLEFAKNSIDRVKQKEGAVIASANAPVLTDRVEVSGKFVSTKNVKSHFGYHTTYTLKGLFVTDAGQKIWMTVSNKIQDSIEGGEVINVPLKLVVSVERSDKDAGFYFGKRPTLAK